MSAATDDYEAQNADDYKMRPGEKGGPIPVTTGSVEDPIDPATADSDKTLEQDEKDAIDKSNIIDERTRGATKEQGTYTEPGDEEGLGGPDDGRSRVSGGPN